MNTSMQLKHILSVLLVDRFFCIHTLQNTNELHLFTIATTYQMEVTHRCNCRLCHLCSSIILSVKNKTPLSVTQLLEQLEIVDKRTMNVLNRNYLQSGLVIVCFIHFCLSAPHTSVRL